MVQDKAVNTKGAQLIFTTHDAMLLDLNFFVEIRFGLLKKTMRLVQQSFTRGIFLSKKRRKCA